VNLVAVAQPGLGELTVTGANWFGSNQEIVD